MVSDLEDILIRLTSVPFSHFEDILINSHKISDKRDFMEIIKLPYLDDDITDLNANS